MFSSLVLLKSEKLSLYLENSEEPHSDFTIIFERGFGLVGENFFEKLIQEYFSKKTFSSHLGEITLFLKRLSPIAVAENRYHHSQSCNLLGTNYIAHLSHNCYLHS